MSFDPFVEIPETDKKQKETSKQKVETTEQENTVITQTDKTHSDHYTPPLTAEIYLGTDTTATDVFFNYTTTNQKNLMTGIYGGSGSGKSALAKIFIEHFIDQGIPTIVLSAKNDFLQLIKRKLPEHANNNLIKLYNRLETKAKIIPISLNDTAVNVRFPIFELERKSNMQQVNQSQIEQVIDNSVNLLCDYGFKTKSSNFKLKLKLFLNDIILDAWMNDYNFYSISELRKLVTLNTTKLKKYDLKGASVDLGLQSLTIGMKKQLFEIGTPFKLSNFLQTTTYSTPSNIVLLRDLQKEDQEWVISKICDMLYTWASVMGETNQIKAVLVIDEAAMYCPSGTKRTLSKQAIERLVRMARHYGVFVLIATQLPRDLSSAVRGNLGITILGKSTAENVDVVFDTIKDNPLIKKNGITKNDFLQLREREFFIISEKQVTKFRSRSAVTDLSFVANNTFLKQYSAKLGIKMTKSKDEPFAEPTSEKNNPKNTTDVKPNQLLFISRSKSDIEWKELIQSVIKEEILSIRLDKTELFYIPYYAISANIKINSIQSINIEGKVHEFIPANMYLHTLFIPTSTFIPYKTIQLNIEDLLTLEQYSQDELNNMRTNIDILFNTPKIIGLENAQQQKINTDQARLSLENSIYQTIQNKAKKLTDNLENYEKQLQTYRDNEDFVKIQKDMERIEKTINSYDEKINQLNTIKREKLNEAEQLLVSNKMAAKRAIREAKEIKEKVEEQKNKLTKLLLLQKKIQENYDNKLTDIDALKLKKEDITNIQQKLLNWKLQAKDTITNIKTTLVVLPFYQSELTAVLSKGNSISLTAFINAHTNNKAYILCSKVEDHQNSSAIHDQIWICSICNSPICELHSAYSHYSQKRICHEHTGICANCGIVEKSVLSTCKKCGKTFCPNHITTVTTGVFKKTSYNICKMCNM